MTENEFYSEDDGAYDREVCGECFRPTNRCCCEPFYHLSGWKPYTEELYDEIKDKDGCVLAYFEDVEITTMEFEQKLPMFSGWFRLEKHMSSFHWQIPYADVWIEKNPTWISFLPNFKKP